MGVEGGQASAQRAMQITAEVARLQLDAPRPISPATLQRLRTRFVPAFVDAHINYIASTVGLQERQAELQRSVQKRIAHTPEAQRIDEAKQAFDASPIVQAATAEKQKALILAAMAGFMDPSVGDLMKAEADARFDAQVHDLPEAVELSDAVDAAQALIDAETAHVNVELYPVMREVEEAQNRLTLAEEAMLVAAGIRQRGVSPDGPTQAVA